MVDLSLNEPWRVPLERLRDTLRPQVESLLLDEPMWTEPVLSPQGDDAA